jgi:hypothetical protein
MHAPVFTIERMVACGGLYIGRQLSARLSIPCLDQQIMAGAARNLQQDQEQLAVRDERLLSFGQKLLAAFSAGSPDTEYAPPPFPFPEDTELFAAQKQVILEAVSRTGAVIIGHGGASILKGRPGVVRVFCHAPLPFRVQRLMNLYGLSNEKEAEQAVQDQDRSRERYLRAVTGRQIQEVDQYDLCIDTSRYDMERAVQTILTFAGLTP